MAVDVVTSGVTGGGGTGTIGCDVWVGPAERIGKAAGLTGAAKCSEATRRTAATASVIDRNLLSFVPCSLGCRRSSIFMLKLGQPIANSST